MQSEIEKLFDDKPQTYTDEHHPYYLASRTDENIHRTDYTRDSNNRITRKDFPADANGIRKVRPAVVVTATADIAAGKPIRVAAITTRLP